MLSSCARSLVHLNQQEAKIPMGTCICDVLLSQGSAREAAAAPSGLVPLSGQTWARQYLAGTMSVRNSATFLY